MKFCPECGTGHECSAETGAERADVAIMRLQCERDIEVARINAKAGIAISENEAEHGVAHAEGVLEGVDATLDAMTGGGDDAGEGEPIVVNTDEDIDDDEPEAEPAADLEPPVVEVAEPSSRKPAGWWSAYR